MQKFINLLERPTSGRVLIDGEDITRMNKRRLLALRRSIGMIFQSFHLLEQRTAIGNESSEKTNVLLKVLKTKAVYDYITNTYQGAVLPVFEVNEE